ncbi:hypothetical protein EU555_01325 [Methylobacterium nonmethylotrophicum]|uniref:Uncharacterized protein n=2 Tax=Methylobacterium nonmethylotrophicum TaxID=1141884 RepID=A0A4Z0NWY7_9HYPH|nr:hypothetical protein EU555_01325 [Methylobacterium nonmethylotrophicum]
MASISKTLDTLEAKLAALRSEIEGSPSDRQEAIEAAIGEARALLTELKGLREAAKATRRRAIDLSDRTDPLPLPLTPSRRMLNFEERPDPLPVPTTPSRRVIDLDAPLPIPSQGEEPIDTVVAPDDDLKLEPKGLQKREYVLKALHALGAPASPATVSLVVDRIWKVEVKASQFSSMRKGDERAWMNGRRTLMIVPAFNAFDLSARPRTVALSSWPLEQRIMGSLSDRADALRILLRARHHWVNGGNAVWLELVLSLARDFRFVIPSSEAVEEQALQISEAAKVALDDIADRDLAERKDAAARAARLSEKWQMFGRPIGLDVIDGGVHA